MLQVQKIIEKELRQPITFRIFYEDKKFFYTRGLPLSIIFALLSILFFPNPIFEIPVNHKLLYFTSLLILFFLCFLIFINPYIKQKLKNQLKIKTDDNFFKLYANKEYFEYQNNLERKKLIEKGVLFENEYSKNAKLLEEYAIFFRNESDRINNFKLFTVLGGILLTIILTFYGAFITRIFELSDEKNIIENTKQILKLIGICVLLFIGALPMIRLMLKDIVHTRKENLLHISRRLFNLKWNEDLKITD